MSQLPPRQRGSQFFQTLVSVLPRSHALSLPPEEDLLERSELETMSERFFHRNFAECDLFVNLYDRFGMRQIDPFIAEGKPGFPATMAVPASSPSGCTFVVAEAALFFLYDRVAQWDDAPGHLAFVAVRIGPELLPALGDGAPAGPALSRSEYLLLSHLLCGENLKAAAASLGASYDTKRKQVQLILDKFGAASQTALLRSLTLEVTARVLDALLPRQRRRPEAQLVKRQFGRDVVVNTITTDDGLDLPVWEFGARRGRPILYFHNMLTPVVFRDDLPEVLRRHNLRWLVVPRHFLDAASGPGDTDLRVARLMRALADTVAHLTDGPVTCLGESAGVSWAVHFVRRNPDLAEHLFLLATPQPMPSLDDAHGPTIYAEISDKLRRDARVTAGLARVYNALARVPTLARRGLRHLYRQSPPDLATLEKMFTQAPFFDWLRLIANVATRSSMEEITVLQRNWLADLRALNCAVTFIHGAQDTISPPDEIEILADSLPVAEFLRIENAGHFVMSQHFPALAAHIAALPGGQVG
ncbi:hypothetical protein U879_16505 [Defluviimonas sp. 20V17]|uniref:Pimeloyl-ACP methyl ester carboxylesterase n=1 Tax=Allgaiera indica TaxID=765699 RepID=A0AAN4URY3_9RHOB|nr:alpha/beta hydrolase [Allgaiera indica]KDB02582.1 hypothetical protein U879_16505 [Defluviimonas sp. 20V17]GHE01663.1 hypothetical protein GCM10008024_17900 [Allgaiera indica]SDW96978.1 Pimeloyl-ACP methyl ester carboxylesterase [Allgaiera indica]